MKNVTKGALIAFSTFFVSLAVMGLMDTQFNLILPENGHELDNVILSPDNMTLLKNNVGVFTVFNPVTTTANPNSNYCPIAEYIHEHEDGYNNLTVGSSDIYHATIPPAFCNAELHKVPEFNNLSFLVLAFGSLGVIIYGYRKLAVF
jgi:hypothetical protein